ncbi:MAG: hypothetical protein WKF47_11730 [Geodermatophilaceae bacterium]
MFDRNRVFLVANFLGVSFTFAYLGTLAAFIAVIRLAGASTSTRRVHQASC